MKHLKTLVLIAGIACSSMASAQLIKSLAVTPAEIKPAESVKATITLDVISGTNCGIKVFWGDGANQEIKINQLKDAVMVVDHTYAKAGTFEVMVEPARIGATLKCGGNRQKAMVKVVAPVVIAPVAPPVVATPKKPGDVCPTGWKVTAAGVNKKTNAFTCTTKATAAAPAKAPETKTECKGDLTYFENLKKGQLGCKV